MTDNNDKIAKLSAMVQMVSYKLRAAITYLLGDGNTSLVASIIFEDILRSYYSFSTKHNDLYEKFDGYMAKTVMDIHIDTFAGLRAVKNALVKLKGVGLIDFKTGGAHNTTLIKITDDAGNLIESAYEAYEEMREEYIASKREIKERSNNKAASKKAITDAKTSQKDSNGLDYEAINEVLAEAATTDRYEGLEPLVEDFESLKLIYAFSKYYRDYTGEAYNWNAVKFNTLNKEWQKASLYRGAEIGLTIALKKELNRDPKSLGGKLPLEKRIAQSFNKDAKMQDLIAWKASYNGYEGVVFYNLFTVKDL